jgi:hypothetical protein
MLMWHNHLQLHLQLKCVVTYDKKLACIHVAKFFPLDLDKNLLLNDVYMAMNINLNFFIN